MTPRGAAENRDRGRRGRCVCWWGYDSDTAVSDHKKAEIAKETVTNSLTGGVELACTTITDTYCYNFISQAY